MADKQYWLHRISYKSEFSHKHFDGGLISIGWGWKEMREDFKDKPLETKIQKANELRFYSLRRFLEMKAGDIVIVPLYKEFSICEITNDHIITLDELAPADKDKYEDLGFFRNIKQIVRGSREEYADSFLTARLKAYNTTLNISDLKESIETAREHIKNKTPIRLYPKLIEENSKKTYELISNILNPDKMEQLVKWYFEKLGANVYIPTKNEKGKAGDCDVSAEFPLLNHKIFVQVKFHEKETSEWAITQIDEYLKYQQEAEPENMISSTAWVITKAEKFSDAAIEDAKKNKIRLITGKEFTKMLLDVGFSSLPI